MSKDVMNVMFNQGSIQLVLMKKLSFGMNTVMCLLVSLLKVNTEHRRKEELRPIIPSSPSSSRIEGRM